jgi:DNA ligase-1
MKYLELVDLYERLEAESGKIKKMEMLADFFARTPKPLLPRVVLLCLGGVFVPYEGYELGIATKMAMRAIAKATGMPTTYIEDRFRELGDLGLVAERCLQERKQAPLVVRELTVEHVFEELHKLPFITGEGSQERKLNLVAELVSMAKPKEARYLVRTVLGQLRVGVAEGLVRDAIARVTGISPALIERAWNVYPHYGEIARIAFTEGENGLRALSVEPGRPMMVMLGEKAPSLEDALNAFNRCILEYKYDGARIAIHKKGDQMWLFTRRLEDVTKQFPDLVSYAKQGIKAKECIVEGEAIGIHPETRSPLPFQLLSQRIQRKYDIERMVHQIPVCMYLFDMLYLNGKSLLDLPLAKRRKLLERWITPIPGKFEFSHALITKDLKKAQAFFQQAIEAKQEGLFVKNLDASYMPGRRVGYMLKVKRIMEPLDLVIVGAEWGRGKRARWLSSFVLACRDPDTGKFLSCGMMGTGFTEEQFEEMTQKLKPLITEQRGRVVKLKPQIVVEVGYEEIQRSPHYESGYALRFPRLLRERTFEKPANQADTIERVRKLFESQKRKFIPTK